LSHPLACASARRDPVAPILRESAALRPPPPSMSLEDPIGGIRTHTRQVLKNFQSSPLSFDDPVSMLLHGHDTSAAVRPRDGGDLARLAPARLKGMLLKENPNGFVQKMWKQRHFVLGPHSIKYAVSEGAPPLNEVHLRHVMHVVRTEYKKHRAVLAVATDLPKKDSAEPRTFYLRAESEEQADEWVQGIHRNQGLLRLAFLEKAHKTHRECVEAIKARRGKEP